MFRFLHAADIHLDSPLRGLDRYESAPVEAARGATRRAFENLVALAIEQRVAFVLIAGDLYDGDWRDYGTGLFFTDQMAKLREAGIRAFVVAGNHDAASQLTKGLRPPDNVHFFATRAPETRLLEVEDTGVAIHGQGFATRAVQDDIASAYPPVAPELADRFHIGLLHTSLDGREGHASYAPTTARALQSKGYHYWALGHVHRREIVSRDPWIVFPGNPQGRHARETGAKGCVLVTVDRGAVVEVEERDLDVLRWCVCAVDTTGAGGTSEVLDRVAHVLSAAARTAARRTLAVRVELHGRPQCYDALAAQREQLTQEIRALARSTSAADLWIEKVLVSVERAVDRQALAARDDALGDFLRELDAAGEAPEEIAALKGALIELHRTLGGALSDAATESSGLEVEPIDVQSDAFLERLLPEARDLLLARLVQHAEADPAKRS